MPCVRPARIVPRCASACSRSAATRAVARAISRSVASVRVHGQRGVQQVGGGHAEVHAGGRRPGRRVVRPGGEERDHVVVGDRLRGGDRLRASAAARPAPARPRPRARCRRSACASSTRVSTRHHSSYLCSSAPDPPHLGQRVTLDHAPILPYRRSRRLPGGRRPGPRARAVLRAEHRHEPGEQHRELGLDRDRRPQGRRGQGEPGSGQPQRDGPDPQRPAEPGAAGQEQGGTAGQAAAWPTGCGRAGLPIVRYAPAASVTTPSRIGMWA